MASRYPSFKTVNYFAGGNLNRASWLRESTSYLNQALVFGPKTYGLTKRSDADNGHWSRVTQNIIAPALSLMYLGVYEDGSPSKTLKYTDDAKEQDYVVPSGPAYFAVSLSYRPPNVPEQDALPGSKLLDALTAEDAPYKVFQMRTVILTGELEKEDAALAAYGRAILDWSERYAFCSACGSQNYSVWGGHKRACSSVLSKVTEGKPAFVKAVHSASPLKSTCPSVESVQNYSYPRSDPVVIVGIVSADDEHILLGRQKMWPKGLYSCIAGFVEPGESIEESVRREAMEETGIETDQVSYYRLFFGAYAYAKDTSTNVHLDQDIELEEAFFASKKDVLAAVTASEQKLGLKSKDAPTHKGERYFVPPPTAMAHVLLAAWARGNAPARAKL
ncbi:NAD(+) diphosphatase [Malassezia japonica]|uniref:NAD(+) diphosphatase n=1 Tax=Malassezia japonica TaxID=223818 RepID=A0AAF0JB05_9BASI|nr:NAD(+) diphosphatase [Malassezia japonica]WFD39389.1 NAD(+) diphosphatase [Malassezia japonica]